MAGELDGRGKHGNPNSLANLIPGGPPAYEGAKGIGKVPKDVRAQAREAYQSRLDKITALIDDPRSKPEVVIKAFDMLHRLSGDSVTKIAATDAAGNDMTPVHDEEAFIAALKARAASLKN